MTRQKSSLLLFVFALLFTSSLSAASVNTADAPATPNQVVSPSVEFVDPSPANNSVLESHDLTCTLVLNYTANYSVGTWYFYDNIAAWNATSDDIAFEINGEYKGAIGTAGAVTMGLGQGNYTIEVFAGWYGYGRSNVTVSAKLVLEIFTLVPVTVVSTVKVSEEPGFTALIAIMGFATVATVSILIRKRK